MRHVICDRSKGKFRKGRDRDDHDDRKFDRHRKRGGDDLTYDRDHGRKNGHFSKNSGKRGKHKDFDRGNGKKKGHFSKWSGKRGRDRD